VNYALPSPDFGRPDFGRRVHGLAFGLVALLVLSMLGLPASSPKLAAASQARSEAAPIAPDSRQELIQATFGAPSLLRSEGEAARLINAALPFSDARVEAARPFTVPTSASDQDNALLCLAQAVYYEAGFEPVEGRRAVAQVVLNRVRHPAFPKSVCAVVYQGSALPGCQFSFTCDGALRRRPAAGAWADARTIAREALTGTISASVGLATHFHTDYVAPAWAPRLSKIRQIGAHIFYRWPGGWGRRGAFTGRYAGGEIIPSVRDLPATQMAAADEGPVIPDLPVERRSESDVGGRLDVTRQWRLSIADPEELGGSLAAVAERQGAVAAPARPADSESSGGS
jgi:spore germination cell wall hydrolase CwlJ-like protein